MRGDCSIKTNKLDSVLSRIFDKLPDGVCVINQNYDMVYINPILRKELGYVKGRKCYQYFNDLTDACPWCRNSEVFDGKVIQREWTNPKTAKIYDLTDLSLRLSDGSISKLEFFHEITERKVAEKKIEISENRYHRLFESAKDGIFIVNAGTGLIEDVNPFMEEMLGYSTKEFLGKKLWEVGLFKDVAANKRQFKKLQKEEYTRYDNLPLQAKDGKVKRVEFISNVYTVDSIKVVQCNVRDITERKKTEGKIEAAHKRLKYLSARLIDAQEGERQHIARELHDEIGQTLTGMKMLLDSSIAINGDNGGGKLTRASALADRLLTQVRNLSLSLRPGMLEDFGLMATLIWYFDIYTTQSGVKVNFSPDGIAGTRFSTKLETAAYRIVQEALSNVARHAQVSEVNVQVWMEPSVLGIKIRDEGNGFNVDSAINEFSSIGLIGMGERVNLLNGKLNIESVIGKGTSLTVELPLNKKGRKILDYSAGRKLTTGRLKEDN